MHKLWIKENPEIPDELSTFSEKYQHLIHNGFLIIFVVLTSVKSPKTKVINISTATNNTITDLVIFFKKN